MGGNYLLNDNASYLSRLVLILRLCFPPRLSQDWLNRCWQPTKRTWIFSGCPLMMRLILLLWRKRKDSVTARRATKAKAAGVKEIIQVKYMLSPDTLHTLGEMCLLLSLVEIKRNIKLKFWNQLCPSVSRSDAKNANEAFESSFNDKGGNILLQSAKLRWINQLEVQMSRFTSVGQNVHCLKH